MKKHKYIKPTIEVTVIEQQGSICGSNKPGSGDNPGMTITIDTNKPKPGDNLFSWNTDDY